MMNEAGNTHTKFHKTTLIFGLVVSTFGLIICGLGIWLIYLKSTGATKFTIFGQEFLSDNVGIAAIFIGAVVLILAIRRILKSLDKISDNYNNAIGKIVKSGHSRNIARK